MKKRAVFSKSQERINLSMPLFIMVILSLFLTIAFLNVSRRYIGALFEDLEKQYRQDLINIVSVSRKAVEPIIERYRSGELGREETINRVRSVIRMMTYNDRDGDNYVFMSSYEGIMLVQPFEPEKEMTDQLGLRDIHGVYIIRELIAAAKAHPEGSFVRYYYAGRPDPRDVQEKLAYVVGIPEIECYIGTGMYMARALHSRKELLAHIRNAYIGLLLAVLVPVAVSVTMIFGRNRQLMNEIDLRRKSEEELEASEKKYRSIFENAVEGIFQTSPEGVLINANPALARIAGYGSPREMIENIGDISAAYADIGSRDEIRSLLDSGEYVKKREMRMKRKDGTLIWVSMNCRSVNGDTAGLRHYEGTIEDITERKMAEELSRVSEEKFSKVFMMAPELITITRMSDEVTVDVNVAFEEITGMKREEVIGASSVDFGFWVDPGDRTRMKNDLLSGRELTKPEVRFLRKDGTERLGLYSARLITISETPHIIFIMQDITENRQLEEENRKLERQMYYSQRMEAIGELAGGVAHDFNNILMGIQGNISMLLMELSAADPHRQRLAQMEEQVRRGANLTRQLLGFAREGKYEIRSLSVNDLLMKSVNFYIETKREIATDIRLQKDLHPVEADAGQLEQAFLNILINAGQAMPTGGNLYILTENVVLAEPDPILSEVSPGRYVKISIRDTGIGMTEEVLKRIFDPFFTTKAHEGGSGMGLASAYGIVRNHRGAIRAESRPGEGSTFSIYLPASDKAVDNGEGQAADPASIPAQGRGTILLIDDEEQILDLCEEHLVSLGYTARKARTLEEAVASFKQPGRIDLVILDMILKGTSGSTVLRAIRDIDPDVAVILSSGYGLQGEVRSVMEMGCRGFIQKPYTIGDLSAIVQKVLAEEPGSR